VVVVELLLLQPIRVVNMAIAASKRMDWRNFIAHLHSLQPLQWFWFFQCDQREDEPEIHVCSES
jgi:hypothetical protein